MLCIDLHTFFNVLQMANAYIHVYRYITKYEYNFISRFIVFIYIYLFVDNGATGKGYLYAHSLRLFVCLFVLGLPSYSRTFHSYGDVTITGEGLQILIYGPAFVTIEQAGFFSVPHLL